MQCQSRTEAFFSSASHGESSVQDRLARYGGHRGSAFRHGPMGAARLACDAAVDDGLARRAISIGTSAVADPVDRLAEEEVADQAVAVRADDQQVHGIVPQVADKLPGGVGAVEQHRAGTITAVPQDLHQLGEVAGVGPRLAVGGFGAVDAGHRRIHHVQQQEGRCRGRPARLRPG